MAWGFLESVVFAAVMTIRDECREQKMERQMERQRKEELRKLEACLDEHRAFYERISEITNDVSNLQNDLYAVVKETCKRTVPIEFEKALRYIPLYWFDLVIYQQDYVTEKQEEVIEYCFNTLEYNFSKDEFMNAAEYGTDLDDFREVMTLTPDDIGTFWINFFRALSKLEGNDALEDFVDHSYSLFSDFSKLGNMEDTEFDRIWGDFCDAIDNHFDSAVEFSDSDIDTMEIMSISEHFEKLKVDYETLMELSEFPNEDGSMNQIVDMIILNSICDIVMATKQPKSIKLQMLDDAFDFLGEEPFVSPELYVTSVADRTELGEMIKEATSIINPLGTLWKLIVDMSSWVSNDKGMSLIVVDLFNILNQIENFLNEKYELTSEDAIAKHYIDCLLDSVSGYCNEILNPSKLYSKIAGKDNNFQWLKYNKSY